MYKLYHKRRLNRQDEWETRQHRLNLKSGLETWVDIKSSTVKMDGKLWYGCFVTFMFNYISGGFDPDLQFHGGRD